MKKLVFPGTASMHLSEEITMHYKDTVELGVREVVRFANSEVKVTIKSSVEGRICIVVQSTSNPTDEHIMELLLTIDALKRGGASKIECIIPYFGYARQNIQHLPGECVSAHVVVQMIELLKADKVTVVDLHDEATAGIFTVSLDHISALPFLARKVRENLRVTPANEADYIIGSPDQAGIERARKFGDSFYQELKEYETITVEKKRNLQNIHDSRAVELFGDVKGKKIILVDDIVTSGGTLLNAATLCLERGAREVYGAIVHPDLGKGIAQKIQDSALKQFYTTDSIEATLDPLSDYPKIRVFDIAEIFSL